MGNRSQVNRIILLPVYLFVAILFVTTFSYSTSPIYHEYGDSYDSLIFQIIGKYWCEGKKPYADLWDMKGPFIFFVNSLGYWLTGNKIGVYIIQILNLSITLLFTHKILSLCFTTKTTILFTLLSLAGLSYIYEGGNLTEEYLLPFMTASFYLVMKWLQGVRDNHHEIVRHNAWYAFVYGVVIAISFLTRLTNALPICAAIVVIAYILLIKKEYRNISLNMIAIIFGFCVVTAPFILYFYYHGLLIEMLQATFIYPLEYAANSSNNINNTGLHYFLLSYLNSIVLFALALFCFFRRQRKNDYAVWMWLLVAGIPFIWFCQGNGFGHYGMIVYPLFAIIMIEFRNMYFRIVPLLFILLLLIGFGSKLRFATIMMSWKNEKLVVYKTLLEKKKNINYNSFVAYNCDPIIYLSLDIFPANRFFAMQDFGNERISEQQQLIKNSFNEKRAEWILLNDEEKDEVVISNILSKNYKIVSTDDTHHLKLYHLVSEE